jgi:hypothetical protein
MGVGVETVGTTVGVPVGVGVAVGVGVNVGLGVRVGVAVAVGVGVDVGVAVGVRVPRTLWPALEGVRPPARISTNPTTRASAPTLRAFEPEASGRWPDPFASAMYGPILSARYGAQEMRSAVQSYEPLP